MIPTFCCSYILDPLSCNDVHGDVDEYDAEEGQEHLYNNPQCSYYGYISVLHITHRCGGLELLVYLQGTWYRGCYYRDCTVDHKVVLHCTGIGLYTVQC